MSQTGLIGSSIGRKEDLRLLTGRGRFVEDVALPHMAHVAFLRSPHPHALVESIDLEEVLTMRGVIAAITSETWPELAALMPSIQKGVLNAAPYLDGIEDPPLPQNPILGRRVRFVGDIVAAIIAEDRYIAADALERVNVSYQPLPAVTWDKVVRGEAPPLHEGHDNVSARMKFMVGDVDTALRDADHVIEKVFETPSQKAMAIECRGIAVQWDTIMSVLNVWSTTQAPYFLREALSRLLQLATNQVRIMSRDIGGGFGLKGRVKPEDLIVALAAYKLGRPMRWIETRVEHMISSSHNGRQRHGVKVAFDRLGKILAIDLALQKEAGFINEFGSLLAANTVNHLPTQYKVPSYRFVTEQLMTNTAPCSPYRGAGRIEAVFTMDRCLDAIARHLGLDPLHVRKQNIVQPEDMPYKSGLIYRNGLPICYKDTDFTAILDAATAKLDYWHWREMQATARKEGRAIGIGIASYVDAGGIGPSETATVRVDTRGNVSAFIGVNAQGQSHETTLAQICADTLCVPFDSVTVVGGDTSVQSFGFATAASRVAVNAGNAMLEASLGLKHKILLLAAEIFECPLDEIQIADGVVSIKPPRQRHITLGELAQIAMTHPVLRPFGVPGLISTGSFFPPNVVWSSGVNMMVVELDSESGLTRILKHVMVHDAGKPLNPAVVDGQVVGGLAQGLSIGLGEQMIFDKEGQPVTGSLMDYFVPRAADVPEFELGHMEFPSTDNPLGIKSVGESGPAAPAAAFAAAVDDALEGELDISKLPVSWDDILRTLRARAERSTLAK